MMAAAIALSKEMPTCARQGVAAIITHKGRMCGSGWNGVASGEEHCQDRVKKYCEEKKLVYEDYIKTEQFFNEHPKISKDEFHAERNALNYVRRHSTVPLEGCTMHVTLAPCKDCAVDIVASGISYVYFLEYYDRDVKRKGVAFLRKHGVVVEQVQPKKQAQPTDSKPASTK